MFASPSNRRRVSGFSLVEVVLAIGVVSFAMLAILGTLPVGIQSLQDTMQQQAKAAITQQLRGELQQLPFAAPPQGSTDPSIEQLTQAKWYFTSQGARIPDNTPNPDDKAEPYYVVTFQLQSASVHNEAGATGIEYQKASARNIQATLEYPISSPEINRRRLRVTLFSANQKSS